MKKLTYSAMAVARLRANKKQYFSLVLGIFLAVFLVTVCFLAVQGFLLAQVEQAEQKMGKLDAFLLDNTKITDEQLQKTSFIKEVGHVYVTAEVAGTDCYLGCYDAIGEKHMYRTVLEGRMPQFAGEIAIEQTILLAMDLDRQWQLGDKVELSLLPIDGTEEARTFTLVGILRDQSAQLDISNEIHTSEEYIKKFPAMLVSREEAHFQTGRIAVHRTFLTTGGKFSSNRIGKFQADFGMVSSYAQYCILSVAGTVEYHDLIMAATDNEHIILPLVMGALLAIALLASCGIGIAGAMEGALSRRSEEIGLLRAVGATRGQIRRIFGRESLILALVVSPLSILAGILAVGIFAWAVPQQMVLKLNPLLLIPILLFSMLLVILSGNAPLRRSARLMPMSVIRDTEVLRKHKHIRSKKQFRVSRLISGRLLQLYPSRQIGSTVLSALMLFSLFCAVVCVNVGVTKVGGETEAFEIISTSGGRTGYVDVLPDPPLSSQSISQLRRLPHVSNMVIERNIHLSVLLEEPGEYLKSDDPVLYTEEEYLKQLEDTVNSQFYNYSLERWKEQVKQYNQTRDKLNVSQAMAQLDLTTVVLNERTIREKYSHWIEAGKIDIDAINAGKEVLIAAPRIWYGVSQHGYPYTYRGSEPSRESDVLMAENDTFYPGQVLPMIQLYCETDNYENARNFIDVQRRDTTVTVGAVLKDFDGLWFSRATIITTEEGLQNMDLYANGYDTYRIYLDGDIDLQTEEMLMQRIEAIASRTGGYSIRNNLQTYRENLTVKVQLIAVFSAISILFTAVVISMIVSSVTRRIQSDGRRIGMLRAVGADEKVILGCYSGQVTVSFLGGFLLATIVIVAILISAIIEGLELYAAFGFAAMIALTVLSWAICRYILRLRIRAYLNKSIIDNIREL